MSMIQTGVEVRLQWISHAELSICFLLAYHRQYHHEKRVSFQWSLLYRHSKIAYAFAI